MFMQVLTTKAFLMVQVGYLMQDLTLQAVAGTRVQ